MLTDTDQWGGQLFRLFKPHQHPFSNSSLKENKFLQIKATDLSTYRLQQKIKQWRSAWPRVRWHLWSRTSKGIKSWNRICTQITTFCTNKELPWEWFHCRQFSLSCTSYIHVGVTKLYRTHVRLVDTPGCAWSINRAQSQRYPAFVVKAARLSCREMEDVFDVNSWNSSEKTAY